jgi:hypothetical protein
MQPSGVAAAAVPALSSAYSSVNAAGMSGVDAMDDEDEAALQSALKMSLMVSCFRCDSACLVYCSAAP